MVKQAILDKVSQIAEDIGLKIEQRVAGNASYGVCYQMNTREYNGLDRVAIAIVYFHQNALEVNPLRTANTMAGKVQREFDVSTLASSAGPVSSYYGYHIAYGDPNLFAEVEHRLTSISSEVK